MKIAILTRGPKLYSTKRLVEAATERGHQVYLVNPLRCYMNIASHHPSIHYRGVDLPKFDAVIPRIGASITFYGAALIRQFEMMDVYCMNRSLAITRSRDKLRCLQLLSSKGVGLPITSFSHSPGDIKDLITMVGGAPLVIKLLEGTQGIGVVLVESNQAAESVIEAFLGMKVNIMVQEYIKESQGSDIRCLVVGGKVIASMERKAKPGEFRSNIHRGASSAPVELTTKERKTAILAANLMGLDVAGVDMLRSERGPLIMEVNSSPGLEGIERTTGENVASAIIQFIEQNSTSKRTKRDQINS
jgi:ribosomal protein S6--L-glutamate ligase